MKTMIAIPCMDNVPVGFARSLLELRKPEGTSVCLKTDSLVYDARNLLSLTAIEQGYDRVLWLDSDMAFNPDLLERLHDDMDKTGADLVTGVYFRRTLPTSPVLFRKIGKPYVDGGGNVVKAIEEYTDYPRSAIFPIDGCGFGCVLTSVELLKRIWDEHGPAFYPYPWASEDIAFCYRAKLSGATMICDSRVLLGHIGYIQYSEKMYERR